MRRGNIIHAWPPLVRWPGGGQLVAVLATMLAAWTAVAEDAGPAAVIPPSASSSLDTLAEPAVLTFFNRRIVVLRATLYGKLPEDRAGEAAARLRQLTRQSPIGPISVAPFTEARLIQIGDQVAFVIDAGDVDPVANQSLDELASRIEQRLRNACAAIEQQRNPIYLLRSVGAIILAVLVVALLIWGLNRLEMAILQWLRRQKIRLAQRFAGSNIGMLARASERITLPARLVLLAGRLLVAYWGVIFCLGRIPYTRVWNETLGDRIVENLATGFHVVVDWLPNLLVIIVIGTGGRIAIALLHNIFDDIESDKLKVSWCDALVARPTLRLLSILVWVFALVMAYPYLPGSNSAAFKGISVFVGLLVSLGASSIISQVIGGFVIMYSRLLKAGDYVCIGDNEGVVAEVGFLSTRIRTLKREIVNVPNALFLTSTSTNLSAMAGQKTGVVAATTITIGYNTPWRQIHAILQEAARRTAGVAPQPSSYVLQAGLDDFYVQYQLHVFLKSPHERIRTLSDLNANIQDVFNEYGVQIMSPHYVADPPAKVWVPKENWHAAPAPATDREGRNAPPCPGKSPGSVRPGVPQNDQANPL